MFFDIYLGRGILDGLFCLMLSLLDIVWLLGSMVERTLVCLFRGVLFLLCRLVK